MNRLIKALIANETCADETEATIEIKQMQVDPHRIGISLWSAKIPLSIP
jgi:hypothetical protein